MVVPGIGAWPEAALGHLEASPVAKGQQVLDKHGRAGRAERPGLAKAPLRPRLACSRLLQRVRLP